MKICTIAGAAAEIHAADLGSVVIDKSYHDLVDAVQKYLEKTIYTNKHASRYLVGGMVDKDDEGSYYTFLVNKKELAHYLRLRTDWELESHVSTIFIKN